MKRLTARELEVTVACRLGSSIRKIAFPTGGLRRAFSPRVRVCHHDHGGAWFTTRRSSSIPARGRWLVRFHVPVEQPVDPGSRPGAAFFAGGTGPGGHPSAPSRSCRWGPRSPTCSRPGSWIFSLRAKVTWAGSPDPDGPPRIVLTRGASWASFTSVSELPG